MARRTVLAVGLFVAGLSSPVHAATCWDHASIKDYNPGMIRALQQRLHDKGLYSGPFDGKAGSRTRAALAQLTGQSKRSDFRLDSDLVNAVFGLEYSGIYESENQERLMVKLGVAPDPAYRDPCVVHVRQK